MLLKLIIRMIQLAMVANTIIAMVIGPNSGTKVTQAEYELLVRVCMSECGGKYGEPLEGKVAVVETILNRCEIYGKTIEEVVKNRIREYKITVRYNWK